MHCVLTVWENIPPSVNTPPFAWWTGVVEVIFLCVYAVDQVIVFRVFGLHHYKDKKWESCFALVMALAWLDWLLYYPIGLRAIFRFARPLRPLLGIAKRKALRRLTASVLRTVPHMLDISMLLFIAVMFFGVVGLQLFNDEQVPGYDPNNDNFNNWADSALAIFILASTENYPNVANLSYKHRPVAAGIFFVAALFVLLWVITPLILAIVYDHFKEVREAYTVQNENPYSACRHGRMESLAVSLRGCCCELTGSHASGSHSVTDTSAILMCFAALVLIDNHVRAIVRPDYK